MKADIEEFKAQRGQLPGDRDAITAIGPYILELYTDPLGFRPSSVIEINKKDSGGDYTKVESVWFYPEPDEDEEDEDEERTFENPEESARIAFNQMSSRVTKVEDHIYP